MSDNKQTTAPVYEDLKGIAQEDGISPAGQCAISEDILGFRQEWYLLEKSDAVELMTEIQIKGGDKIQQIALQDKKSSLHSNADSKHALEPSGEETPVNSSSRFTDEDTGEVIEITQDFLNRAHEVQGFIRGSFYLLAEGLAALADEKLYGAFGYTSFRDYCRNELDFGFRQAYKYAVIGRSVAPHLQLSDGQQDKNKKLGRLEKIGITKLNEIIKNAEDQVERLINDGKITINDHELTDEEIKDKTVRDLRDELKRTNEKAARAELLEEQKKNVEMKKETLEEENQDLKKWKYDHRERADKQDEIGQVLTYAENVKAEMAGKLKELDPDKMFEVASEDQRMRLAQLLNGLQDLAIAQKNKHIEVVAMVNEQTMDA